MSNENNKELLKSLPRYSYLPYGLPLLLLSTLLLLLPSFFPLETLLLLSSTISSLASMHQLQILHDCCHNTFHPNPYVNDMILTVAGSISYYGYTTYLRHGHLGHHTKGGSMGTGDCFDGDRSLGDGDALFSSHRNKLQGAKSKFSLSLSSLFTPYPSLNVLIYALTFSLERVFLGLNDVVTMVLRRNLFFPNAEAKFGGDLVRQSTVAVGVRGALVFLLGWKVLLSLYIAELSWTIPPNPLSPCFLNNHSSPPTPRTSAGPCVPTSSYLTKTRNPIISKLYSLLTLNTNAHLEHHDFPAVPFTALHKIRSMEGYESGDDKGGIGKWFGRGGTYGCQIEA